MAEPKTEAQLNFLASLAYVEVDPFLVCTSVEVGSDLPKVLFKVLFWALLKVFLLRKVLFNVLKKVL